ncbi:MAG TPA: YbaN family protein [Gemmatimonadales bacterium]|nr:YbaN family protein [Gemmatimonadales bacterium]
MRRQALVLAGHGFLALGAIGAFLPVMPTVVFVIAAAACYARGNPALHRRLLEHPRLGPPLRDWEEHRAMTGRTKALAIAMVILGISASAAWLVKSDWLRLGLLGVGTVLVGFLLSIKTRP